MADQDQVQLLLSELGSQVGLPSLALDADGYAVLAFDEVLVSFEAAEAGHLLLSAHLGKPAANEAAVLRAALDANLYGRGTNGATLSRDGASGGLVLQRDVAAAGLSYPEFSALLEGFVNAAETWRGRVRTAAPADAPADTRAAPTLMPGSYA